MTSQLPRTSLLLALVVIAIACGDDVAEPAMQTTTGGEQCASVDGEYRGCLAIPVWRGVDVLFVVDRSARMGPAQAKLARAMPALVDALDELPEGMGARVAFAVAEDPVPPCPGLAPAEPVLASCRAHLEDFVAADGTDIGMSACLEVCELDAITTMPGRPEGDGPWIEWDRSGDNLGGIDVAKALACAAPQGIAGCAFPAPLGATVSAAESLVVEGRIPVAVIVSDAADCTLEGDGDLVFDPDSNRTFWTDPTASEPMPAICWNAGVTCTGPADAYDACELADKDFAGEPANYMDRILAPPESIRFSAAQRSPEVAGIVGVPEGWQRGDVIPFAAAEDPQVQRDFGIGPACVAADGSFGLPSVRVQAFAEQGDDGVTDLWSICADDWAPTMRAIVALAREQLKPMCMPFCVADVDDAAGLQVDCEITVEYTSGESWVSEVLPRCEGTLDAASVPAGAPACWLPRSGDALSPLCRDTGWNFEIDVHWPGPIPYAQLAPSCTPSDDKHVDCPGLP